MSIRLKLRLSLLAMVIVPQLLFIIVALLVSPILQGKFNLFHSYEVNLENLAHISKLQGELEFVAQNNPSRLEDPDYKLNKLELTEYRGSGLIILKNGQPQIANSIVEQWTEEQRVAADQAIHEQTIRMGKENYYVLHFDFTYSDGMPGVLKLFFNYEPVPVYLRPFILIMVILSVAVTHIALTYMVSRSLIKPLDELKNAVDQMKDGNLNYEIQTRSADEIGQVSLAFEDMRIRLKQSIEQTLQYEENRKVLISNISHDLKTPITAIKGYVEGIMDGVANTVQKREKYMQTIYKKAVEMDRLIDELFLYSKLDLNKEPFYFQTITLEHYLSDYLEELKFEIEKREIELSFEYNRAESITASVDPEKLSRVLSNILDNSLKYMKNNPSDKLKRIIVRLRKQGQQAVIEVHDTGPGIAKEALPQLFDRFYRAEPSRNSEQGGSGLGLAIVKHIVEGHGGTVIAASIEGEGSEIRITLPLQQSKPTAVKHVEKNTNY